MRAESTAEPASETTPARLDREITGLGRATRRILARVAALLLVFKRERHFAALGFGSLADYAGARLEFSARKTRELVELAERTEGLPGLRTAFETGSLHWTKLRTIARVATPEDEQAWLERARRLSSRALELAVAEAAGERAPRIKVLLELTDEQYADLEDALRALRRERRNDEAPVSREAGLLELVRRGIGATAGSPRPRFQTVIYRCTDCGVAVRETRLGPVPVEPATDGCARCDSDVIEADRPSRVTKTIPPAIRRHVLVRDRGRCAVPGCSGRDYVDVHHVVPRASGGGHDPSLLATMCDGHHIAVHDGAIRIEGRAPALRFFTAGGQEILGHQAVGPDAHVTGRLEDRALCDEAIAVLAVLGETPLHTDDVIHATGLTPAAVNSGLGELALYGITRAQRGYVSLGGV